MWVAEERRGHSQAGIGERGRGDCRQRCRAGLTALGGWSLRDTASLCQLANLPTFRLVGLLGSWRVGGMNRREAAARAQDRSIPEKKGVGTPASIFPHEGEKKKGGVPTHSHRTGCREE